MGGLRTVIAVSEGPSTRLGQIQLAGEVVDDEPIMPSTLRVMDAYVLSVVLDGEGTYRDADQREERILPGAHTIIPPGFPHWYGTDPGHRWTELFAVFTGPLFDFLAGLDMLGVAGPRYPRPVPSIEALRTILRTPPQSIGAAEHQLLALADWLLDTKDTGVQVPGPEISAEVAHAVGRLADDLTGNVELQTLAAESGLDLRHLPAPLHRAGGPLAVGLPYHAPAPDGCHAAATHRHDPSRDRPDPGFR